MTSSLEHVNKNLTPPPFFLNNLTSLYIRVVTAEVTISIYVIRERLGDISKYDV